MNPLLPILLFPFLTITLLTSTSAQQPPESPTPNILLILIDNVGYGDLACYGNKQVLTPNTDRLPAAGVLCAAFYIAAPSRSPSRGALLTGRHPQRNGLNYQLSAAENANGPGLPRTEKIIPQ